MDSSQEVEERVNTSDVNIASSCVCLFSEFSECGFITGGGGESEHV